MTKRYTFILLISLISITTLARGPQTKSIFKLDFGTGLQTFSFSSGDIDNKANIGLNYNLGYEHYLSKEWAFYTGMSLGEYSCNTIIDATNNFQANDQILGEYKLTLKYQNIHEQINSWQVSIPVGFKFSFAPNKRLHTRNNPFSTSLTSGILINVPISSKYETKSGTISSVGFFEDLNLEITNEPQYGFYTREINSQNGNLKLNPSYGLFAQIEVKTNRKNLFNYYIAAYSHYGLSNVLSDNNSYNPLMEENFKSIINQNIYQGNLLAFGLKLGLIFSTN